MASDTPLVVAALLDADATLAGLIGEYNGGSAVITEPAVPEDVPRPFVAVELDTIEPFDTKDKNGREVRMDVLIVDDNDGDPRRVIAAAERVWQLLHRTIITIPGWCVFIAVAEGPDEEPSEPHLLARRVSVTYTMLEE